LEFYLTYQEKLVVCKSFKQGYEYLHEKNEACSFSKHLVNIRCAEIWPVYITQQMYHDWMSYKNVCDQMWRKQTECQEHFGNAKLLINNFDSHKVLAIPNLLRIVQKWNRATNMAGI